MMRKNSQLHLLLETSLLNKLKEEAKKENTSIAELCRRKLRGSSQLDRIEEMIKKLKRERYK